MRTGTVGFVGRFVVIALLSATVLAMGCIPQNLVSRVFGQ
jgi:hypothetical protein